jgi:hypothetical protein
MPDGAMRRSFPWLQFDGAELRDEDFFKQAEDDEEFAFCRFRSCSGQSGNYLVVNSGRNLFAEYPLLGTRYTTEALLALHANLWLCSHHSSALPSP